ncbi:MAG: type II toxin-antitoxin system RelE/ParE family toxin [Ruminococcus sp.]|nr:type II toxin-antitoxin system RelE/ParE family toxin [Ruminococcus sp.]
MEYSVRLAPHAIVQIQEAVSYISKVLNEPNTANSWADYLQKEISKLDSMPARFPLVENEKWAVKGIRKFPVKNFIVYYYIDEDSNSVWVTAVVYSGRDQLRALNDMPI